MPFDVADIRRSFDARTLERGQRYIALRRVLDYAFAPERDEVRGTVAGSSLGPYTVTIRIDGFDRRRRLLGDCSCPVGVNCKHAAALALVVAHQNGARVEANEETVDRWIDSVADAHARHAEPPVEREHLRYAIALDERPYGSEFRLNVYVVRVLKSGSLGAPREYALHSLGYANAPFVTAEDRAIARLAHAAGFGIVRHEHPPSILAVLLEALIETGRLHWRSVKEPALRRRAIANAGIVWTMGADGLQRPTLDVAPAALLLPAAPVWYVDAQAGTAGPASLTIPADVASDIARAPALNPQQAERAAIALRHVFTAVAIPGPIASVDVTTIDADPVPILRLFELSPKGARRYTSPSIAVAELTFAYGDRVVAPGDAERQFRTANDGAVTVWPRRNAFERAAVERLQSAGFAPVGWPHLDNGDANRSILNLSAAYGNPEDRWLTFLTGVAPQLRRDGWRVDVDASFPYAIVDAGDEWQTELFESEAPQWFELELGIDVGGRRISLLPVLIDAIRRSGLDVRANPSAVRGREAPFVGRSSDGRYVALAPERVAQVLAALTGLFDDRAAREGRMRLPAVQAAAVTAIGAPVGWSNAPSLRALVDELTQHAERHVELPSTFEGRLRPYQEAGVAWLEALRAHALGGVLADDMGLGKTVQVLAHLASERFNRVVDPALIVAPTSVAPNWRAEIARFYPSARVVWLTGPDRAERFDLVGGADIVLTTYALLPRDLAELTRRHWSVVVLDEAQAIKNPRAKVTAAAMQLRAHRRIALTGTPVENHLEELWSIYAFAVPGLLPDRTRFARLFRTPIEKHGDEVRRRALAARIRPFLMRRTKELVAPELPDKTEILQRIELTGTQRDLYETIRLAMHKRVRDEIAKHGLARSRIVVLDALLKLRQVCCDPRLLKLPAASSVKESQKLDALLEMLESLLDDGRRILLFSQFTSMLDLIAAELQKRSVTYVELRGETRDRETPVQRFQRGEVPLFLISLKAGGTGLNLTAADTVIHYDPWWNPAVERQATDRAHRIGQEQHVFVYKLVALDTVEERILELQQRKGNLVTTLFEDTANNLNLNPTDLDHLFS